jgi:hypothetical protein
MGIFGLKKGHLAALVGASFPAKRNFFFRKKVCSTFTTTNERKKERKKGEKNRDFKKMFINFRKKENGAADAIKHFESTGRFNEHHSICIFLQKMFFFFF